jgi:hypothetical protein
LATYVAGIYGVATGAAGTAVVVDANGQLGTVSSSIRYKEDVQPMDGASERLLQLRPVTFRYKKPTAAGEKPVQYGLIAEEVALVFPELVVRDKNGQPETVAYHLLASLLLNELQKDHARLDEQKQQIALLQAQAAEVDSLKAKLADLERLTALLARLNGIAPVIVKHVSLQATDAAHPAVAAR